jgi:endonuclease/exonuclease/phosphatase (EEP) superfamily protein YafD
LSFGFGLAAVAAQGGRWNDRLDLLTHFAPLWLAGGAACLLLTIFMRRAWPRVLTTLASVAAAASAGGLMWMDLARLPTALRAEPAAKTLKLVEFNAWQRNATPQRVGQWLAQEDPDVVVIAESSPLLEREIAARTGLHMFHGSGVVIATRGKPLSEHVAWEARTLPGASTEFAWVELRGQAGQPFTVVGVHCLWPIPSRSAWGQDRNIAALLATLDRSDAILTGDFNSTQWSFRQRVADAAFGIERRDVALPTWPARLPMMAGVAFPLPILAIDHVYAGSSWKTVSVKLGPNLGSDHYPLVATLAWAPGS